VKLIVAAAAACTQAGAPRHLFLLFLWETTATAAMPSSDGYLCTGRLKDGVNSYDAERTTHAKLQAETSSSKNKATPLHLHPHPRIERWKYCPSLCQAPREFLVSVTKTHYEN
jgi:hypothetical protein